MHDSLLLRPHRSLIGREQEIMTIRHLLTDAMVRLLTLAGPPGVGKTVLALHIAETLSHDFPQGVVVVLLSSLTDASQVERTIAQTLGLGDQEPVRDALIHHLKGSHLLLILDNFEHVIEASFVLSDLLDHCSHLQILVTSRERLHLREEQVLVVEPLQLPDQTPPREVSALLSFAALAFFQRRAQAVKPDFLVTEANGSCIAEICIRLDGLPLAIELAAAHLRFLTPNQLLTRLANSLDLLAGGPRDLPRHQTLAQTIAWSYQLLNTEEQQIFCWLSVFCGGCSFEAAELVCMTISQLLDLPVLPLVQTLHALLDKNLLHVRDQGGTRFFLLQTIRGYALSRLEACAEDEVARAAQATYSLSLAEKIAAEPPGPGQETGYDLLTRELSNLRAAFGWFLEKNGAQEALRMCTLLAHFWAVRGHLREGLDWFTHAFSLTAESAEDVRASAYERVGWLALRQGSYEQAKAFCQQGLALFKRLGDSKGAAAIFLWLGSIAAFTSDSASALHSFEQAAALARHIKDDTCLAYALMGLGNLARVQGQGTHASHLLQESCSLFRLVQDREGEAWSRFFLGRVLLEQAELTQASLCGEESLAFFRTTSNKNGSGQTLGLLGHVLLEQGEVEQSLPLLEEAHALVKEVGNRWGSALIGMALAKAHVLQGESSRGVALYRESLSLFLLLSDQAGIAACLEGLASTFVAQQDAALAVYLWGAADQVRQIAVLPMPPLEHPSYRRQVTHVQLQLGETTFTRLWTSGQAVSPEQILRIVDEDQLAQTAHWDLPVPEQESLSLRENPLTPQADRWSATEPLPLLSPVPEEGSFPQPPSLRQADLTPRQLEILSLLVAGLTNAQIAEQLVISLRTVHAHVRSIYTILHVSSRKAATQAARSSDLISPPMNGAGLMTRQN